jgi:hypothetical protein
LRGLVTSRAQRVALALYALVLVLAFAGSFGFERFVRPIPAANEYSVPAWEARHFLKKWLFQFGELFRDDPSLAAENEQLARFLALNREIAALERQIDGKSADAALAAATRERDRLEARAQAVIEGRISAIAQREGLTLTLPLLPDLVWPPVDLEFTTPPRTLAVSPRDRIELTSTTLIVEGLDLAEVEAIEREREADGDVSARAFDLGGVGAYPTINQYPVDYGAAVELAAHEWMHNYLFFHPLGIRYFASNDLRTMNETVANLVGREIAHAVLAEWPLPQPAPATTTPTTIPSFDLGAGLRQLRGEVDVLLAAGEIEAAEARMEAYRQFLAENGVFIRRLNQAYFAFTNLYAGATGSPGAVNPIGPKIDELRLLSGSLGRFVRLVEGFTSVSDLDAALAALREAAAAPVPDRR